MGTGINWGAILPYLITGGASAAGNIIGAKLQTGAIDRSGQLQAETAQKQLDAIINMYGLQRGDRAPHRAVGINALNTLQNWKPGGQNALAPTDLSKYRPNTVDLPPQLSSMTTAGSNAFSPPSFGDISTSGIHGRAAGVGGRALTGAGLGATAGSIIPGVGTAVGAAGGAIYGGLSGLFDNNNSDKDFATEGIKRVGPWVWNTVMPAVKAGTMTPDQAEQAVNQTLAQWEQSMRGTPGFNQDVLQRSVSTQRAYLEPFFQQINAFRQGGA